LVSDNGSISLGGYATLNVAAALPAQERAMPAPSRSARRKAASPVAALEGAGWCRRAKWHVRTRRRQPREWKRRFAGHHAFDRWLYPIDRHSRPNRCIGGYRRTIKASAISLSADSGDIKVTGTLDASGSGCRPDRRHDRRCCDGQRDRRRERAAYSGRL